MTVLSIKRDFGDNISIVRMVTNDPIEIIGMTGYIASQRENISIANNGDFTWQIGDSVLIQDENSANTLWNIFGDFNSVIPSPIVYNTLNNIVAHAGGGQTDASQLNAGTNQVTIVATLNDSVKLPDNVLGQPVIVLNLGANALQVFPFLGDSINALSVNSPITVSSGSTAMFVGSDITRWAAISS